MFEVDIEEDRNDELEMTWISDLRSGSALVCHDDDQDNLKSQQPRSRSTLPSLILPHFGKMSDLR